MSQHISLPIFSNNITREKLFRNMEQRYQITQHSARILRQITLPHSKARPQLVCYDARNLLVELLTDPRIQDDDTLRSEKGITKNSYEEQMKKGKKQKIELLPEDTAKKPIRTCISDDDDSDEASETEPVETEPKQYRKCGRRWENQRIIGIVKHCMAQWK